jgi:hypothetical protein
MPQHDYVIADASGLSVLADLNNALAAIATGNSGNAAPSVTYAYMPWNDTLNGLVKVRNAANTEWVVIGQLGAANLGLAPLASPVFTGPVTVSNLNGGPLSGTRNRIINGGMRIDQFNAGKNTLGAVKTFTAGAARALALDRWYGYCTGANVTGQQVNGVNSGTKRYRFTGAAGCTGILFGQMIESANIADLAGTTATLSVELANTLLTTVTWTAFHANTDNTFGTQNNLTRTQIATGTFAVSSAVNRYSAQIALPAAAFTGVEVVLSVSSQTSGTWTIGNVMLEPGSTLTPFVEWDNLELLRCLRYACVVSCACSNGVAGSNGIAPVFFPVNMRVSPGVVNLFNGAATGTSTAVVGDVVSNGAGGYFQISSASAGGAHIGRINYYTAEFF